VIGERWQVERDRRRALCVLPLFGGKDVAFDIRSRYYCAEFLFECYTGARPEDGLRRERSAERFIKKPYNQ
jgi:hypothetical protein